MTGFVFAMLEEAVPFINKYKWNEVDIEKFKIYEGIYQSESCVAIISGIGKVNALVATLALIDYGVDRIVNVGSCGANAKYLKIGDVVQPKEFYDGDFDLSKFGNYTKNPYNLPQGDGLKCYSFSRFVTDKVSEGDYIVDMEAYAIACLAHRENIDFVALKIVSDNANEEAAKDFDTNINNVMEDSVVLIERMLKE